MTEFMNPAVDERIVRLNAILKTTSVKKEERENLKAKKAAIKFILNSWDKADLLNNYIADPEMKEMQYEIWCIVKSRIDQLEHNAQNLQESTTPKKEESESKAETPRKAEKKTPKHKVGDLHPNGKWIWKEYKPGKFDWRNAPKELQTPKKESKTKQTKKTSGATTKKKTETNNMTFTEFMTRLKTHGTKNLTDLQSTIRKYLLRGYKVDPVQGTGTCFLKKKGETPKSVTLDSVSSLFRKTGVTDGLILRDAYYKD